VKSPYLFSGYWRQPDATRNVLREGWLGTGDEGYVDDDSYLHITGRIDDVIIVAGTKIHLQHVDDVLRSHASVQEAATVAVPDPVTGTCAHSFVVLTGSGGSASLQDLRMHCERRLGRQAPGRLTVVDALPRTHVGKLDRLALKQRAVEEHA
jgi:acyl-coenzyme A synthetase/AMP-(fatty) acid ligase